MPYLEVRHEYSVNGEECFNLYQYWNGSIIPNAQLAIDLGVEWVSSVLPAINAVQMSYVDNIAVSVFVPNLATSFEVAVSGGGNIAGGTSLGVPPDLALVIKRQFSNIYENDPPGDPYTGARPVRSGRFFLSGLPKSAIDGTGFVPGGLPVGSFVALESVMTTAYIVGGNYWQPVVVGKPLPATGSKPARAEFLVGVLNGLIPRRFTSLATRND